MIAIMLSAIISSCSKNDDDNNNPSPPPQNNLTLLEPEDNSTGVDPYNILLEWQPLPGMDESSITYSVGFIDGDEFESFASTEDTSYELVIPSHLAQFEKTYYWTVIASDDNGLEVQSEVYSFTTRLKTIEDDLIGLWLGSFGNDESSEENGYGLLFRPNGTVRLYSNNAPFTTASDTLGLPDYFKADGTYSFYGAVVTGTYHFGETLFYSFEGNMDTDEDFILGTWGNGENVSDGGLFDVEKYEEEGISAM